MPPTEEEEQNTESSMRDDFAAAIESVENDEPSAVTTETAASAEEQSRAEDLNDDDGQETAEAKAQAKVEAEAGEATDQTAKPDADAGDDGSDGADTKASDASGLDKAPESWSPAAREAWKDVPESARAQIAKREGEINKFQNEGAEHRKTGAAFQGIADRYAQVFAAEGAPDAITGIEELVKTVGTLRMGSKAQKVAKVAGFIEEYGIDIGLLDDHLSGNLKPTVDDPLARMLDERLKPVDNLLAQMSQNQKSAQFQKNQDAINEVQTFRDGKEFYDDVSNDMADMVEMAEKRGVTMPLQEAYDKACALNPEISSVLSKRTADAVLTGKGETLEAKRQASGSLNGKQGGAPSNDTSGMSLRQTLSAAMDGQVG